MMPLCHNPFSPKNSFGGFPLRSRKHFHQFFSIAQIVQLYPVTLQTSAQHTDVKYMLHSGWHIMTQSSLRYLTTPLRPSLCSHAFLTFHSLKLNTFMKKMATSLCGTILATSPCILPSNMTTQSWKHCTGILV